MSDPILVVARMEIPAEYTVDELEASLQEEGEEYEIAEDSANEVRIWFGLNDEDERLFVSLYESTGEGASLLRAESEEIAENKRDRVIEFLTENGLLPESEVENVFFEIIQVVEEGDFQ